MRVHLERVGRVKGVVAEGVELWRVGRVWVTGMWEPTNCPTQLITDHAMTEKKQPTMPSEIPDVGHSVLCPCDE